jgi:hypothetical protein
MVDVANDGNGLKLKMRMLAEGIRIGPNVSESFGPEYLEKRRAYGNPDPESFRSKRIPQEIVTADGLVVAVNVRQQSPLVLREHASGFVVEDERGGREFVSFPRRPRFYDQRLSTGETVSKVITLYGGGALGIFAYGDCDLVIRDVACAYCSIGPNRSQTQDFEDVVRPKQLREALSIALTDELAPISQVMLNGGNFPDMDRSFRFYAELARTARETINACGRPDVELHLIAFPPRDLELLKALADLDLQLAINVEVFDPRLFEQYCPGKAAIAGQAYLWKALEYAVQVLGPSHVFSIVVGGLEGIDTLNEGLNDLAQRGITPVVNVFHPDPGTPLATRRAPTYAEILAMGRALQSVYATHHLRSFYTGCGRNSIDTEAERHMFPSTDSDVA